MADISPDAPATPETSNPAPGLTDREPPGRISRAMRNPAVRVASVLVGLAAGWGAVHAGHDLWATRNERATRVLSWPALVSGIVMLGVGAYYGARRRRYPAVILLVVVLLQALVGGGLIAVATSGQLWLGTAVAYLLLVGTGALIIQSIVSSLVLRVRQVPIDKAAKERAAKGEIVEEEESGWEAWGHPIRKPPPSFSMLFFITFFWAALLASWATHHLQVAHTIMAEDWAIYFKWQAIQDSFTHIVWSVSVPGGLVAAVIYYARKRRWLVALGWLGALPLALFLLIVVWPWR